MSDTVIREIIDPLRRIVMKVEQEIAATGVRLFTIYLFDLEGRPVVTSTGMVDGTAASSAGVFPAAVGGAKGCPLVRINTHQAGALTRDNSGTLAVAANGGTLVGVVENRYSDFDADAAPNTSTNLIPSYYGQSAVVIPNASGYVQVSITHGSDINPVSLTVELIDGYAKMLLDA